MPNWVWVLIILVGGSIIIRWISQAIKEARENRNEEIAERVAEKMREEDETDDIFFEGE